MDELTMLYGILNSYPYPIVFVDNDFIIRYMNNNAKYHYYTERGYSDRIGKSLFDCHDKPETEQFIRAAYEQMKRDGKEKYLGVSARNQRVYIQGVRDEEGNPIGFFERFELNLYK